MHTFSFLEQFHQKHGHVNVPVEYEIPDVDPNVLEEYGCDRALGKWLRKQREHWKNKQLPDDRAKKLENLGVQCSC